MVKTCRSTALVPELLTLLYKVLIRQMRGGSGAEWAKARKQGVEPTALLEWASRALPPRSAEALVNHTILSTCIPEEPEKVEGPMAR